MGTVLATEIGRCVWIRVRPDSQSKPRVWHKTDRRDEAAGRGRAPVPHPRQRRRHPRPRAAGRLTPTGPAGRLYWHAARPFHGLLFKGMAHNLADFRAQAPAAKPLAATGGQPFSAKRGPAGALQRVEKRQQRVAVGGAHGGHGVGRSLGFAAVPKNGLGEGAGASVV